jgi:hypothetical protein
MIIKLNLSSFIINCGYLGVGMGEVNKVIDSIWNGHKLYHEGMKVSTKLILLP